MRQWFVSHLTTITLFKALLFLIHNRAWMLALRLYSLCVNNIQTSAWGFLILTLAFTWFMRNAKTYLRNRNCHIYSVQNQTHQGLFRLTSTIHFSWLKLLFMNQIVDLSNWMNCHFVINFLSFIALSPI